MDVNDVTLTTIGPPLTIGLTVLWGTGSVGDQSGRDGVHKLRQVRLKSWWVRVFSGDD